MVKAQKWLDKEYPVEERRKVLELDLNNRQLEGILELKGFNNLKELNCMDNKITVLDVSNAKGLERLYCSSNQIFYLSISNLNRLQRISAFDNDLEKIEIGELNNLEHCDFSNNQLSDINLDCLNPQKLNYLDISSNNLPSQDLSCFARFSNLEYLNIGNDNKEKVEQGVFNRFFGSLEPLKNLTKLCTLYIQSTDVSGGLECLADGVESISFSTIARMDSQVERVYRDLLYYNPYQENWPCKLDIKQWKINKIRKLERENQELKSRIQELEQKKEQQIKAIKQNTEKQIDSLKDQNRSASYTIDQLRNQMNENSGVSSALSSFYSLSEVRSTNFSSKSLTDQVYYLKDEFERAIREKNEIQRSKDYWEKEEYKERQGARRAESRVEELEERGRILLRENRNLEAKIEQKCRIM